MQRFLFVQPPTSTTYCPCNPANSRLLPLLSTPQPLCSYPADGFSKTGSLLGAMGNTCERLDAQYTLSGMGGAGTPAPAPEPTTTTSSATALPAAGASAVALAALTAAAAMLF